MIPNQWYVVLESREIRAGSLVSVTRLGEKMVFWRDSQGNLTCLADKCPHRGSALSAGKLVDDCIQCPFHGFEFNARGVCTLVPASGRSAVPPKALHARSYPVREAHGFVYLWWGELQETYPPVPFFENIPENLVYSTLHDHWQTHYARAIENQLDMMHLPFVHHNTIGAGNRTVVNGPVCVHEQHYPGDNLLNLWIANELDHGQTPLKPSEMSRPAGHPLLQFRFPNLWQNWLGTTFRLVLAFVPVDEENTRMYLRSYYDMRLPVLRQLSGWLGNLGNRVILNQDKRVVLTQRPKRPDIDIGETLVPGDHPIIVYRKIRRELIEQGQPANH